MCCKFIFTQGKIWGCQLSNYLVIYTIGSHQERLFFSKLKKKMLIEMFYRLTFNMHLWTLIRVKHFEHGNL